jgi:hypothetical protein
MNNNLQKHKQNASLLFKNKDINFLSYLFKMVYINKTDKMPSEDFNVINSLIQNFSNIDNKKSFDDSFIICIYNIKREFNI